jgi:hypothetical protein
MKIQTFRCPKAGNPKLRKDFSMSAVVICDDLAFAASAGATLGRVGGRGDVNVQWKTKFWSINALNEAELAKKALLDALDAHLILFPARCAQSLPDWVFDWLNQWATLRRLRDAAIGVMADECPAELVKLKPLLSFARMHDLAIVVDEQRLSRIEAVGFAEDISNPCYRCFGIND